MSGRIGLCALLLAGAATSACAAEGGAMSVASDASVVDADAHVADDGPEDAAPGSDALFPTDDASVLEDASPDASADTTADVGAPDTAPACGAIGEPCCTGAACTSGYCHSGTCWAKPELLEETSDPGGCADLGKTHVSPAFLARWTVFGRPGATAYRYARHVSCAGAPPFITVDSPVTIGSDGKVSRTLENTALTDCLHGNLGRWETWVVVDGQESAHHYTAVFNSACPAVGTCPLGATFCPE